MKLIVKPNHNSGHIGSFHGKYSGKKLYETVDLCDEDGTVWASTHIDLFSRCGGSGPDPLYDALYTGHEVVLDVARE